VAAFLATFAAATPIMLVPVANVTTFGNAGFEAFSFEGKTFLAAANFFNGKSPEAHSPIYELTGTNSIHLNELQAMTTKGAHGWDFFEGIHRGKLVRFLVVPNYYGCGSGGLAPFDCDSTVVYTWESESFEEAQTLHTAGPGQTDHLVLPDGRVFLLVGENFNNEVVVYELQPNKRGIVFIKVQALPVQGAGAMAVVEYEGRVFLVAASYHDAAGGGGWATRTTIFQLEQRSQQAAASGFEGFKKIQTIATHGCHDAEFGTHQGSLYLFLSEDRDHEGSKIQSKILKFDLATHEFKPLQQIPTDGAHAAEFFHGPGDGLYLAVANFGDRLGKRYAAQSSLWRYEESTGRFELVAEVPTVGATDWEHFVHAGRHYLAVSNEGDLAQHAASQASLIYRLEGPSRRDEV